MEDKKEAIFGLVVFYQPNYKDKTIKEISRTEIMSSGQALEVYANTPNPASQVVFGETLKDIEDELKTLEENIKNPKWLEGLFECI